MSGHVPQILSNRFRLGALNSQQATRAIKEPASLSDSRLSYERFEYSDEAVEEILQFLRARSGQTATADNDVIDPSQLQIVCQHVERDIVVDKQVVSDGVISIEAADLGGQAGLEHILRILLTNG